MKQMKVFLLGGLLALAGVASAVTPGQWGTSFAEGRTYAETKNVPIVVFFGRTTCTNCKKLLAVIESSSELEQWLSKHPIVCVKKHEPKGSTSPDYVAAREWILSLTAKGLNTLPLVGLYWKKPNGELVQTAFTGTMNGMPSKTGTTLAQRFVNSLDMYFADYKGGDVPEPEPTPGESGDATFVTRDTEEDRLEATAETKVVYVPLRRETSDQSAANVLSVTYPNGVIEDVAVVWEAGESQTYVEVEMSGTFTKGKEIALILKDVNGAILDTSSITMVAEEANSPTNPHWVGDYSSVMLPYGEWTMDYEAARQKLVSQGGYILTVFTGVKWCPHCIGIDDSLFADKKFYTWAKQNKVLLVVFDQPRFNSDEGCQYVGPRLLSYNNDFGKSGASYLSRNGLKGNDPEVLAAIDLQWEMTRKWLAPESTASRLSNPTILLLDSTGTQVAARMNKYELEDRSFPTAENINRFNDLLLLVDADEREGYRTVTPLSIAAGGVASATLQINDKTKFLTLTGVNGGEYVKVTVAADDKNAPDTTVAIYAGSTLIASGSGRAVTRDPVTADEAKKLSVKVSSFAASQPYGAKTSFVVTLGAEAGSEELVQTVAFSSLSKSEHELLNPALYGKRSATVPVYESVGVGGKRLVGTLAVGVSTANKITAKFTGEEMLSFSGTWKEINLMSGTVTAALATKAGATLVLAMNAEGGFEATLGLVCELIGSGFAAAGDFSSYAGAYTVTLVDPDGVRGTGHLSLNVTKTGKTGVKGVLPDGTTLSLSSALCDNGDGTATLPIYKAQRNMEIALALSIAEDAESTWGDEGNMDTVKPLAGCLQTWTTASDAVDFNVYGGYWQNGATPLSICELFGLSDRLAVVISGETNDTVTATKGGFKLDAKKAVLTSLSFAKSTGVFSGKAKIATAAGAKAVSATVKGVLLPGWIDCGCIEGKTIVERPYGSGTLIYKLNGMTVSEPIDLVATPAE